MEAQKASTPMLTRHDDVTRCKHFPRYRPFWVDARKFSLLYFQFITIFVHYYNSSTFYNGDCDHLITIRNYDQIKLNLILICNFIVFLFDCCCLCMTVGSHDCSFPLIGCYIQTLLGSLYPPREILRPWSAIFARLFRRRVSTHDLVFIVNAIPPG